MRDYTHYNQQGYNVLGRTVADVICEVELSGSYEPPSSFDSVFPNPSNSIFQFQFRNVALEEHTTIQIFDTQSNLIKQLGIDLHGEPIEKTSFDLSDLPNGIFLLRHRQKIYRIKVMH
jgi:hypothetical protein